MLNLLKKLCSNSSLADPGGGGGGKGAIPPGPAKISYKKDGRQRQLHRFPVSWPPTRLLDPLLQFKISWVSEMLDKSKLRNCVEIKQHIRTSSYVKVNLDKGHRSLDSQLLCGILPLQLELGRYSGIPRENRLCPFCGTEPE